MAENPRPIATNFAILMALISIAGSAWFIFGPGRAITEAERAPLAHFKERLAQGDTTALRALADSGKKAFMGEESLKAFADEALETLRGAEIKAILEEDGMVPLAAAALFGFFAFLGAWRARRFLVWMVALVAIGGAVWVISPHARELPALAMEALAE